MKKRTLFLSGITTVGIVAVTAINISVNAQSENLSDAALINVEALTTLTGCDLPKAE
ncbi:MAG: hypothetical protein LBH60_06925 [Prevotellaceae bacterium]|jgi:hypothetical protein|nr:hypothetical protein [Prevotellaceae bacterium]